MSLGEKIKIYRKEKGYTQGELSELLGVSVQAISKWETNSGMPDISQLVPLSKTLGVSIDLLLENSDEDISLVLNEVSNINCMGVFCSDIEKAKETYNIVKPCFDKHPTSSSLAYHCLESLTLLLQSDNEIDKSSALQECSRYMKCIEKHENNTDCLFKSYYIMSKCFKAVGDNESADSLMNRIPDVFGDKLYWEAEVEFRNQNYDLALQKCKESFTTKARYVSRCIRLARQISEMKYGKKAAKEQFEYSKYMLRMIDAFLSGGDYISHRLASQKIMLLCGLSYECIKLGMNKQAIEYAYMAADTWKEFKEVQSNPDRYNSIMLPTSDNDGWWNITDEKFEFYWSTTINRLATVDEIKISRNFEVLKNMFK